MTRENKPAAQSAARRAASLLTGALLLAGLTGCSGDLFLKGDSANTNIKAKPAVALAPAQGVPQKYAGKVNDQLAATIKANGVAIVDAKDAIYVVKPTYVAQAGGRSRAQRWRTASTSWTRLATRFAPSRVRKSFPRSAGAIPGTT